MFFKRHVLASPSFVSPRPITQREPRRALAALALSASFAAVAMQSPALHAQELPGVPGPGATVVLRQDMPAGNADRLKLGVDQYRRGEYEEALATLQQVDASQLPVAEQQALNDTLAKAEAAANERKAARAEFEKGEVALAGGNSVEAITYYRNAANNRYADEGTRAKAREQIALAESQLKGSGQGLKDVYAQAVADYKAGNFTEARTKFMTLDAAGFKSPMFQRSPQDYLKDIDRRMANAPQNPPSASPMPLPEPSPAPQTTQQPMPPPAVTPEPQNEVTLPPGITEVHPITPTPEPAPIVVPETQSQQQWQSQPAPQAMPTAQPIPDTVSKDEAKNAYKLARQQYNDGDWQSARRNFEIAQRGNYKPGLFEDSPAKYLARMDNKEMADASHVAQQGTAAAVTGDELRDTAMTEAQRQEQNRAEAQQLVEAADQARAANRVDEALNLYTRAADLDPSNDRAQAGKSELMRLTGREPAPSNALDRQAQEVQQTRQYVDYTIKTALDEANAAAAAKKWSEAHAAVTRAEVARETNPGVFTQPELAAYDASIATTRANVNRAEDAARVAEANEAQIETTQRLTDAQMTAQAERDRTIRDYIKNARQLTAEGKYHEALGVIDQILVLDPTNDYALGARPLVEERWLVRQQRDAREAFDLEMVKVLNRSEEQRVPYNDVLIYPSNWPDLVEIRERTNARERGDTAEDQQVQQILEKKLPEVRLDQSAFSDVVDFLRDISGANLFVNWRALEGVGIDRTTPVTARLRDVKFSKVLRTILDDVGAGNVRLGYTIDEGVITISTEEDLANNVVTRVYDIRDLIINVPDFDNAPDFSLQGSSAGGGGGGSNLFGGSVSNQQQQGALTRQELVDAIIKLIQDTVSSDSWKDNGGSVGSIRELAGQLIVTQTPENQRALIKLLEQLRETRAIQVTVEARFLVVQRNFLEDIGVDFDAVFNINGDNNFSAIPIVSDSFEFSNDLGALDTTIPGSLGLEYVARQLSPSLTTGFTFLDDFQVSLLIRATQAAQNSSTLTAPRVTLFNGQRAFVLVATETAYVSDLTPIVGTNAVAFDPQPGVVQSGVLLDVVATVSSDRKYVTLTLRPTLSRLRDLVQFPVSAQTTGGGDNGGVPTVATAFLQQPVRDITTVRTTVSVPDGGTLMIGGQTLNGEVEREAGVPILSKIPFLKRLFTNRSTAKDDQILLILIRPTIIIQREREAEQFPLLNSN